MATVLLVVGLQKSGTTILSRMLAKHKDVVQLARGEGDGFWGNKPSFTPTAYPAGRIYRSHQGAHGHAADAQDADARMVQYMQQKLNQCARRYPGKLLMNKNPYNTVRIRWLRQLFPKACIVAIHRDPLANAFSLKKRYVAMRKDRNSGHWWGVKPNGWRGMINRQQQGGLTTQIAKQVAAVHKRIQQDAHLLDYIVSYDALCAEPEKHMHAIFQRCLPNRPMPSYKPLHCFNHEYKTGARIISQNKGQISGERAKPKLNALTQQEIAIVKQTCYPVQIKNTM